MYRYYAGSARFRTQTRLLTHLQDGLRSQHTGSHSPEVHQNTWCGPNTGFSSHSKIKNIRTAGVHDRPINCVMYGSVFCTSYLFCFVLLSAPFISLQSLGWLCYCSRFPCSIYSPPRCLCSPCCLLPWSALTAVSSVQHFSNCFALFLFCVWLFPSSIVIFELFCYIRVVFHGSICTCVLFIHWSPWNLLSFEEIYPGNRYFREPTFFCVL